MTLIHTVSPDTADAEIEQGYEVFHKRGIEVPMPLRLISASPGYFKLMIARNQYFSNHPNLSFSLLAHIRYFASKMIGYEYCQLFNKKVLMTQGVSETDFKKMGSDPGHSLLEAHEKGMLLFVLKAMRDPASIGSEDIDLLHRAGWNDGDIFDALAQGVGMADHKMFMEVFKPDFSRSSPRSSPEALIDR